MSLTCVHSVADARNHPECQGCCAIPNSEVREAQRWDAMSDDERRVAFYQASLRRVHGQIDEVVRLGGGHRLLESHDSAAERAAFEEPERPGTWFGDPHADGRELTQDETDMLVRAELWSRATFGEATDPELRGTLGDARHIQFNGVFQARARQQRGGICSDPLVRVLAWRAWGDHDRCWAETTGVVQEDLVDQLASDSEVLVARSWGRIADCVGFTLESGRPGQLVLCQLIPWRMTSTSPQLRALQVHSSGPVTIRCRVSDCPRAPVGRYLGLLDA